MGEGFVRELASLLDHLGIAARYHVLGHSTHLEARGVPRARPGFLAEHD